MSLLFGEFELDEERRQLLRAGRPVSLEPKAYELLTLLAERRPRALSRAQIRDALWPGTFISESTLNQVVAVVRQALDDDHQEPRYIRTARGFGYAFCAEVRESGQVLAPAPVIEGGNGRNGDGVVATPTLPRSRWQMRSIAVLTIALALATASGLWLWRRSSREVPAPRLTPLTGARQAFSGSLSPDDRQLAFATTGGQGENWDIWLTMVEDSEARRLTTDPAIDLFPAWSPDGKQIAFVRAPADKPFGKTPGTLLLVSPMGGPERRLADFLTLGQPSWSPDGRWLAVARHRAEDETAPESGGIQLVAVGGGEVRALTSPAPPAVDTNPAFSPDGRSLAYATCDDAGMVSGCDIYVLPLDRDGRPQGPSRQLTREKFWARGTTWTRDGRSILYGTWKGVHSHVWRIRADGTGAPERIELAGLGALGPLIGHSLDRLVFTRFVLDFHMHRLQPGAPETPFAQSTMVDFGPQYSPDGRRVVFQSERAEERDEVWLADADGTNAVRLTRGPGKAQGGAGWSPDGRTIVFQSNADDGSSDIWTIGVDGSGLKRITNDPGDESWPSFSRDGRLLYFVSARTGRQEIWRVPAAGGAEEQVTHGGGIRPLEAADGLNLYYMRTEGLSAGQLVARPTQGGPERVVALCVPYGAYAVGPLGVFHVGCDAAGAETGGHHRVWLRDAAGRDREVATIDLAPSAGFLGFTVAPDGSTIIYATAAFTTTVMMIENFQ
jgi:Tol biopolymer transport system component/DNA-binding winged helix-turn-helix (wHTH) protein